MKRCERLPELLAPAGSLEALYAAILGGADAVYIGGRRFGARAFAKNFDDGELALATRVCHASGVRLFVTVNTMIYDKETEDVIEYVGRLRSLGVDALIVSDLGVARLIRKKYPDIELHASTQCSAHNSLACDVLYSEGFSRVVLARECTGRDIREIVEKTRCECEVFVHGAICVCHSGQCLFSSLVGGRSGNRGECAQPCRLPYNGGYPLSLRDMGLYSHIEELISSGVSSLKIEGRMKSPGYVYTVTSIYRRLLDEGRTANGAEIDELLAAFSRGEFTDGYFTERLSRMTGIRSSEDKQLSEKTLEKTFAMPKAAVSVRAKFAPGEPASLEMTLRGVKSGREIRVSTTGAVPEEAKNAPLDEKSLGERLAKLGNTLYFAKGEDISVSLSGSINMSPSEINALRRSAAELLDRELNKPLSEPKIPKYDNKYLQKPKDMQRKPLKTAVFLKGELLGSVIEKKRYLLSGLDIVFAPLFYDEGVIAREGLGVYLPPVIMESELALVRERLDLLSGLGVRFALVSNLSHIALCQAAGLEMIGDFRLNIANRESYLFYSTLGVISSVLSAELTLPQARDIGGGVIVFGRIPLMLTERCFIKEISSCERRHTAALTDRRGAKFPIICEWQHRNLILNSRVTYMGDRRGELDANRISHRHFIISCETLPELEKYLTGFDKGISFEGARRIGKN